MKRLMHSLLMLGLAMLFLTSSYAQDADVDTLRASDVNEDGIVNILDLTLIATHLGERAIEKQHPTPDVNGDGTVNILDLVLVVQHIGESIPQPSVKANPPSGSTIAANASITLTFDNAPIDVTVNAGSVRVFRRIAEVSGPFTPGPLALTITWADGTQTLNYMVTAPDNTPPTVTGGTVKDGDKDVDPEPINTDGIEITFDEDVTGNFGLQTEEGDDVGWISTVEGTKATLTPIIGKEIGNNTTYVIAGRVSDAAGNDSYISITFVTITPGEGLVNYWPFDEGKGDIVADVIDSDDGEIRGAKWVEGVFGEALEFDSVDKAVVVPDYTTSDLTENITIMAWFYPPDTLTNRAFIVKHDSFHVSFGEQNQLKFVVQPHDTSVESTDHKWRLEWWYHLAVTFDGKTMRVYIDGELNNELPHDTPITASKADLVIGHGFFGIIDDVRIYNRALSESEIQNARNEGHF